MKLSIIKPNVDRYSDELLPIMNEIFESNMLTNVYNYTAKFEEAVKEYIGVKNAIAVSSCTAGLILTLEALGIRNKEVILPSFTFVATPATVYWTNNKTIFVDIDDTFTLDPEKVKEKINEKTAAILGVHMYGNPVKIKELSEIASDNKLSLIYDAAHGLGSKYHSDRIGKFGNAEVFSLSPTKLITTIEGGLISTNDDELARKLRVMRNYGMLQDYTSEIHGLNARMSEMHAAVGFVQMKDINTFVANRKNYVDLYKNLLSNTDGIKFQNIPHGHESANKDFSIIVDPEGYGKSRDELGLILEKNGVGVKKYFYPPMHRLKAYEDRDTELPMTDYVSNNILSLPIYNFMGDEQINYICDIINGN